MDKSKFKIEHWRGYGRVYVKRDNRGRIQQWLAPQDLEAIPEIVVHPLKNFGVKSKGKQPFIRRKNPKKAKITIKLPTDLVELLNFLRGRKSLGVFIEELLRESLSQYQTL